MNPLEIINKYYDTNSELYEILIDHSTDVTNKALDIAHKHPELNINIQFVKEAGMLHDIGIFKTNAPTIECNGTYPYIAHGYLGAEILQQEGYPLHALVCERHTGTGISLEYIIENQLPIPHRDMRPQSIEEKAICFADCFYSKTHLGKEKSVDEIRSKLQKFNKTDLLQFDEWCRLFLY